MTTEAEVEVHRAPLVHGDYRNVGQIRAYLLRAESEQGRERHRQFKLAMYGRSALQIRRNQGFFASLDRCDTNSDCEPGETCVKGEAFEFCTENPSSYTQQQLDTPCSVPLPFDSKGSGVLIGDRRLLTGLHVVDGHYEEDEHEYDGLPHFNESTTFELTFDGAYRRIGDSYDSWGTFVAEAHNPTYVDDETRQFQVNLAEENPLLANRLFQLGLENWARNDDPQHKARWTRNHLRTDWPATFAQCPRGLAWCDDEDSRRGFGTAWAERDIAVFEASAYNGTLEQRVAGEIDNVGSNEVEEFLYKTSGSFLLDSPAVFFNRVPAAPFLEFTPNNNTPIWSGFYQDWLDDHSVDNDARSVPLIARDAVADVDAFFASLSNMGHHLWRTTELCEGAVRRQMRHSRIPTTVDAYAGSSGGAVFACEDTEGCGVYDGDGGYRYDEEQIGPINTVALLQSLRAEESKNAVTWGQPTGHGITQTSYTAATPLDELSVGWAEHSDDAVVDSSDQPARLRCLVEGTGGCLRWDVTRDEEEQAESESGPLGESPGIGSVFNPGESGSTIGSGGTYTTLCGWGNASTQQVEDTNCDCSEYAGSCDNGTCLRRDVQVTVGFIGSGTVSQGYPMVADLRPVCGPWTGTPYTENWRHLRVEGATYGFEHNGNPAPARLWLHEALNEMSETRAKRVRPPSMKLCPPNYLPEKVYFSVYEDPDTKEKFVTSLDSMVCKRVRATQEKTGELVTVNLHDLDYDRQADTYDVERFDGYTLAGDPFRLEQRIGYPNHGRFQRQERQMRTCAPGIVRGINAEYDSQGRLRDVGLECIPTPQP